MKEKGYVSIDNIRSLDSDIIIFGAGVDGSRLYKKIAGTNVITCFADNGAFRSTTYYGVKIVGAEELKRAKKNELIIIASLKYKEEIREQLTGYGYRLGEQFFIWDGIEEGSEIDLSDENIQRFINLNKKLWGASKTDGSDNKILIPYRNTSEIVYAPWSYISNLLARKYDASIYCVGGLRDSFDEKVLEIYKSFNVTGIIDETISGELSEESVRIYDRILPKIRDRKDVKDITIYGENFGIDILRDYLRVFNPILIVDDLSFERQLKQMIDYVVYWHDYFMKEHDRIKAVVLWDGLYYREGIMRKIAYGYNIPVYSVVNTTCFKWDYDVEYDFEFYKKYFNMLTEEEKEKGIAWAKDKLNKHISGDASQMQMVSKSVFSINKTKESILEKNEKKKVMICPHYSEDDAFPYGDDMLFDDPWDWMEHLGELSNRLDYDWYLKQHPIEKEYGDYLIREYIKKYPKIKLLDKYVSPVQLKNDGIRYALTIHGSIGYEYPLIGINVINAGYNPHIAFNFNVTPKTLEEYDHLLSHLDDAYFEEADIQQIYAFYCIHYLYLYPRKPDVRSRIFIDDRLKDIRGLKGSKTDYSTELFSVYVNEITKERHEELIEMYNVLMTEIECYKKGVFNRKSI